MKITLVAAVAAVSLATPALADESEFSAFFRRLFEDASGYACFMRAYDQAHLDAHPRQNVASVLMLADDVHRDEPIFCGCASRSGRRRSNLRRRASARASMGESG